MAVTTGRFTGGWRVTLSNQNLPFDRAAVNKDAVLRLGDYTAGQFATEIARAMNAADASQAYTCTFDFSTRKFTTDNGATAHALEFTRNPTTNCAGLMGFDDIDYTETAGVITSAVAAGVSFSLTAGIFTWAPTDPSVSNSPVTAAADGTTATRLQRKARSVQHETDGGLRETIYYSEDKRFRIEYRYLSASEQTNMETLLDWLRTGAPVDFRPDDTAGSTINMRLVMEPMDVANAFSWVTRTEADYPSITFVQQLTRT